jgi:hypothetical protein
MNKKRKNKKEIKRMTIVDITSIFFEFIYNISTMEYSELKKTQIFNDFVFYINNDTQFILYLGNQRLYFEDINSLFYGSLEYCTQYGLEAETLKVAIKKMELSVEMDDLSDIFESNL